MQQGTDHKLDAASLQACVKAQNDTAIKASVHEGESLGVDSTPTLFINGQEMSGGVAPLWLQYCIASSGKGGYV